jgi:protein-L-isoaspartate(D-aspartate) O-methyltransferase
VGAIGQIPTLDGDGSERERQRTAVAVATAEFLLRLRARGIAELDVLRALEQVPRQMFVPHRYADLAARDVALPIGCGQTMPEPFFLARMLEAMKLQPTHRVLEIGTGSGYLTAVLGRLTREVLSIERFQSLVIEARTRLAGLRISNAGVVWGDGLVVPPATGPFDRIVVEALVEDLSPSWLDVLTPDGMIIAGRPGPVRGRTGRPSQQLMRIAGDGAGGWSEEPIIVSRLQPLVPGVARGL